MYYIPLLVIMNYTEENIIMEQNKQNDMIDIIHNLKYLEEALIKCKSEDIFKSISRSSSNFFYEIIQNADDASASEIDFKIYDDKIIITNNGRGFEKEDILKLCGVNHSKEDKGFIGRFGVGFKIAYTIAEGVDLYSNGYYIKIKDFVKAEILSRGYECLCNDQTTFVLHLFKNDEDYYATTDQRLIERKKGNMLADEAASFSSNNFLMLNNLLKITISYNDQLVYTFNKTYEIQEESLNSNIACYYDKVIINNNEKYLIFKSQEDKDKQQKDYLKVAYKLGLEDEIIPYAADETTLLNAFFPLASINTGLSFMIQANFMTDISRLNVDFSLQVNKNLLDKLVKLVGESIIKIVELSKRLNYNLYPLKQKTININENGVRIFNLVVQEIMNVYKRSAVILGQDGKYHNASNILTCIQPYQDNRHYPDKQSSGRELNKNLLNTKDLFEENIFVSSETRLYWLDNDLENIINKNRVDNPLLNDLKFVEVNIEAIIKAISNNIHIITSKSDEWLIEFYKYIFRDKSLIGQCKRLPIFKDQAGEFSSIINENNDICLYLKMGDKVKNPSNINIFNQTLLEDEALYNTIKASREIIEYDILEIIKTIIEDGRNTLTYQKDQSTYLNNEEYFKQLSKILDYLILENDNNRTRIIEYIKNNFPIKSCKDITEYLLDEKVKDVPSYCSYINNNKDCEYHWDDKDYKSMYIGRKCKQDDIVKLSVNNNSLKEKHYLIDSTEYKKNLTELEYNTWTSILESLGIAKGIVLADEYVFHYGYSFVLEENIKRFNGRMQPENYCNPVKFYMPSILYIKQILENISFENSKKLWCILAEMLEQYSTNSFFINYYANQSQRIELKNELIEVLKQTQWIYKDNKVCDPLEVNYNDIKDIYFDSSDINIQKKNKVLCRVLGITIDRNSSARSQSIQKEIQRLSNEDELKKLVECINNRLSELSTAEENVD